MGSVLRFFRERIWAALPAEVSARDRRIAGIAWPVFLVLFGGLLAWRRHRIGLPTGTASYVLFALAPLMGAALLGSAALGSRVYRVVMLFFLTLGFFVSHALLIVFFYVAVTPLGLLLRLMGKDLIDVRGWRRPTWTTHAGPPDRRRFYRLF